MYSDLYCWTVINEIRDKFRQNGHLEFLGVFIGTWEELNVLKRILAKGLVVDNQFLRESKVKTWMYLFYTNSKRVSGYKINLLPAIWDNDEGYIDDYDLLIDQFDQSYDLLMAREDELSFLIEKSNHMRDALIENGEVMVYGVKIDQWIDLNIYIALDAFALLCMSDKEMAKFYDKIFVCLFKALLKEYNVFKMFNLFPDEDQGQYFIGEIYEMADIFSRNVPRNWIGIDDEFED